MLSNDRNKQSSYVLNSHDLMREAQETSGLSDYGEMTFIKPLTKLLDCVSAEVDFHPAGLQEFRNGIVRELVNRLRFQNDLKHHPEILEEDVSDPIVILGLPRSGTTKVQRMMGADPSLLKTYMWQILNPAPLPNEIAGQPEQRIAAARMGDSMTDGSPELNAAHHFAAEQIDEDWMLFDYTFNDVLRSVRGPSPTFKHWIMSRREPSDLSNYQYVRSLFQYLQWQQGGGLGRRWVMKNCGHIAHLDALLETFPKATLMHVHRDPAECIPSFAKLIFGIRSLREQNPDLQCGAEHLMQWASESLQKYEIDRKRLQLDERIIDVKYEQIRVNPLPVFKDVYRRAGHSLTADAEMAMLKWEAENEQHRFGKHSYTLEEFGLSQEIINAAFGDYINRYL